MAEPLNILSVSLLSFILGNLTGFIFSRAVLHNLPEFNNDLRINYLIVIVSSAWFLSVLVNIINPAYQTSPLIHGIMGAVVGYFFWKPRSV